ncbi:periplasmic divalent manganese/zinc-binding lipoprotein [Propionigenium maris DSM 9537]|uniref:Periplasmic divalent manganese/zinc-binding lipoprotein n=1 Tax=Propionigenium maris DSM 9537 TaxID=1123000 RepID=A0A9W6LMU2_9FUSO|nr:zinc ABC transporter substrate-binding protein [Propionigenium maris]GLI55250.1 periplasmic divalent manganese/zinc-binding lipoprotein [Propionigenium maris DSM 9537]
MKKIILFLLLSMAAYGKLEVATTIFPVYDAARVIGGDRVEVSLLVTPGVEPHSFEPSPRDIARINKSDVFLYLNEEMETWIEKFRRNVEVETVSTSQGIPLMSMEEDDDHSHEGHHHHLDPHIWLDPLLYIKVVENITQELERRDPENAHYYRENFKIYSRELEKLSEDIVETLEGSTHKQIIYAGHFSFGYFTRRYGLDYISVYKNLSPNAEISPKDLKKVIEVVAASGQRYIFQEALVNSKTAKLISNETGVEVLMLHQLGGVTRDDLKRKKSYLIIMRENLENLRKGLE